MSSLNNKHLIHFDNNLGTGHLRLVWSVYNIYLVCSSSMVCCFEYMTLAACGELNSLNVKTMNVNSLQLLNIPGDLKVA